MKKDFSKIALQTSLFKGQTYLFYIYLKSEKIAHVLLILEQKIPNPSPLLVSVTAQASALPILAAKAASGGAGEKRMVAEIFAVLTGIRLLTTKGEISEANAAVLLSEYEQLLERFGERGVRSETVFTAADLIVTEPLAETGAALLPSHINALDLSIKDSHKGHTKGHALQRDVSYKDSQFSNDRRERILSIIKSTNGISIKGISAIVRDCSEKTIQRELGTLIDQGLVIREGERRWSIYRMSSNSTQPA
jgi:hypothetical protein